jgi:hypothetical protein
MIDEAVNALLRSNSTTPRVTPSTASVDLSKQLPRVVYTAAGGPRPYTDDGPAGIVTGRYQLDAFAATATEARAVLRSISDALDGFRGGAAGTTIERIHFPELPRAGSCDLVDADNHKVVRMLQEMIVSYRE